MTPYRLYEGNLPLLVTVPHAGTFVPPGLKARMTACGLALPDTDWHVDRLYDFVRGMGASLLVATHARYVIDLNRPPDDESLYPGQVKTGLCPTHSFDGDPIWLPGEEPEEVEILNRTAAYWQPFHEALESELARLVARHGTVILYDAHSIRSQVPRLFEGRLPDLNLGTANGQSCAPALAEAALQESLRCGRYAAVLNGRFVGGYITRHYGAPDAGVHALQMELAQCNYMQEEPPGRYLEDAAAALSVTLARVLDALVQGVKVMGSAPPATIAAAGREPIS